MAVTSIGKSSGEDIVSLGTQAWNIADGFTKIKILRILIELDLYEVIALFGKQDMNEPVEFSEIPYKRVEGFERMLQSLKQLISNCKFAIKKDKDKEKITDFEKRLKIVEEVKKGIAREITNDLTKEIELQIHEEHFKKCFEVLQRIKEELNIPVNDAGLIFKAGETLDLDDFMKSLEEGE
jgi:hypothetical protein